MRSFPARAPLSVMTLGDHDVCYRTPPSPAVSQALLMHADPSRWDTSAGSHSAHTRPAELAQLGEHQQLCSSAAGLWVALRCAAAHAAAFTLARPVTSAAVVAVGAGLLMLAW